MTKGRPSKHVTWFLPAKSGNSGVFAIECKATKRVYIGASKDIRRTLVQYKSHLTAGTSLPSDMISDYAKYGPEGFGVSILEEWKEWDKTEDREGVFAYATESLSRCKRRWVNRYKEWGVLLYSGYARK